MYRVYANKQHSAVILSELPRLSGGIPKYCKIMTYGTCNYKQVSITLITVSKYIKAEKLKSRGEPNSGD